MTVAREFPGYQIAAVYLKTGDQCDYQSAEQAGYGCFFRSDFLDILKKGSKLGITNPIFSDFYQCLRGIEESVQGFRTITPQKWVRAQWKGFFMALKEKLGGGEWDNRGHSGGGSLTFRWHCQTDKYLGLHNNKLFFSIEVTDESQREAKRSEWSKMLLAKNGTTGIWIRPSSCRLGNRMTVAFLVGDYLQKDGEGLLDLAQTADVLKKAMNLMDTALGPA
jgi:hypothetical protein